LLCIGAYTRICAWHRYIYIYIYIYTRIYTDMFICVYAHGIDIYRRVYMSVLGAYTYMRVYISVPGAYTRVHCAHGPICACTRTA
jgi:hypothetical protein